MEIMLRSAMVSQFKWENSAKKGVSEEMFSCMHNWKVLMELAKNSIEVFSF